MCITSWGWRSSQGSANKASPNRLITVEPTVQKSYNTLMDYGNTVGSLRQLLTSREGEIVFGTMLGDGYLAQLKTGVRLEVGHSIKQKQYVSWKYKELERFVGAKPHQILIKDARYQETYFQWRFSTRIDPFFVPFRRYFYEEGQKRIRKDIKELLRSPLSLAVWLMDDGGRRNDSYGMFLNTLSFTLEEHELLRQCLRENFSLESRIHWVQDGYRLYIPSKDAKRLCESIYLHLIPSMRYKLSYNPVTTSFARLDRARDRGKKPSMTRRYP